MSARAVIMASALAVGFCAGAHAANDDGVTARLKACFRGAHDMREWTCVMEAFPEPMARQWAKETLAECERGAVMRESREWHAREVADCARIRDYIRTRWGG